MLAVFNTFFVEFLLRVRLGRNSLGCSCGMGAGVTNVVSALIACARVFFRAGFFCNCHDESSWHKG